MRIRNILRDFLSPATSASMILDSHELASAKEVVLDRGYSYCRYSQGSAITHEDRDLEFERASSLLLRNGYLLVDANGDLVGVFSPLNDKLPARRPKLVVSND